MGCDVVSIDVSANALRVAEQIIDRDPLRADLSIQFLKYNGVVIDLPSNSVDRIVCIDCFHHVADQKSTLQEFYRILRPGGIVGFSEPGPQHSLQNQSQYEMKKYGVIENDIILEDIWRDAAEIGYSEMALSYSLAPQIVDINAFNQLNSRNVVPELAKAHVDAGAPHHSNRRIFYIHKPGGPSIELNSRTTNGLAGEIEVRISSIAEKTISGSLTVRNTGTSVWLESSAKPPGQVLVGVHQLNIDGGMVDLDYARISLGQFSINPAEERSVDFELPLPIVPGFLEFDLVAEGVAWFEVLGGKPMLQSVPGRLTDD
jgi:hypothetical protein